MYSFSSLTRYCERRVAGPTSITSRPVASGSSVPVWPPPFVFSSRRVNDTMSCEVGPDGLSTSKAPCPELNGLRDLRQDRLPHRPQRAPRLETRPLRGG